MSCRQVDGLGDEEKVRKREGRERKEKKRNVGGSNGGSKERGKKESGRRGGYRKVGETEAEGEDRKKTEEAGRFGSGVGLGVDAIRKKREGEEMKGDEREREEKIDANQWRKENVMGDKKVRERIRGFFREENSQRKDSRTFQRGRSTQGKDPTKPMTSIRCVLANGSAWCAEQTYSGTYNIFRDGRGSWQEPAGTKKKTQDFFKRRKTKNGSDMQRPSKLDSSAWSTEMKYMIRYKRG